ncbi:MAG: hypothetical protein EU551_04295 [Promethearchaeota archaeon]|nr:MAG: hypothetical protein EU551_04295 [Candidatus Lokiarchaeota archaeon]
MNGKKSKFLKKIEKKREKVEKKIEKLEDKIEEYENYYGIAENRVISWNHGGQDALCTAEENLKREITWKFPNDLNDKYSHIKNYYYYFAVKDYEEAIFLHKGEIVDVLKGGVYEIEGDARIEGTEIIWVDSREINLPFGIAKNKNLLRTADGFNIGAYCNLALEIYDTRQFINKLSGPKIYSGQNLQDALRAILEKSLSDIIQSYNLIELANISQNKLASEVIVGINDLLMERGIKVSSFGPVSFLMPEEARPVIDITKKDVIRESIKIDTIKELSSQDEIDKVKMEIEERKLEKEKELELKKREKLLAEQDTKYILDQKEKFHTLESSDVEIEIAKKEAEKKEIAAKADAKSEYYKKKFPAEADIEIERERKKIEVESEKNKMKAKSEAYRTERMTDAEARVKESGAKIDITKLEVEKELAKKPDSKITLTSAYGGNRTKYKEGSEIGKIQEKIEKYEEKIEKIDQKIEKIYQDLVDKKISETVYNKMFESLNKDKRRIEALIESLQKKLKNE